MSISLLSRALFGSSINSTPILTSIRTKYKNLDYSRFPVLKEDELEEKFIRGSGPGGQAVNKTSNCVELRHKPTKLLVKCHMHRSATQNQKEARKILLTKLDNLLNGTMSIESQIKVIESKKLAEKRRRQRKLKEMRSKLKEDNEPGSDV